MKTIRLQTSIFLLSALFIAALANAEERPANTIDGKRYHHVVIVWLKRHGDPEAQRRYIEGSKRLSRLPGVLDYAVGPVADIKRDTPSPSVDNSFDIAVSATFESQEALENYSKHPEHHKVIQEVLKPLVDKYRVYDFVE
ncbi:MAG: Dabb family protein [Gammaproteobacteria bacterium]